MYNVNSAKTFHNSLRELKVDLTGSDRIKAALVAQCSYLIGETVNLYMPISYVF